MEGAHRLGQKLRAFWPLGPSRLGPERETKVVLGLGPLLRQLLARPDLQGTSVGAYRLGQKLSAFWPLAPSRLGLERDTQVVLGRGPVLRQLLARVNF